MGIRTRRARRNARTHIVGFGAAGVFGFIALLVIAIFASLGGLIDIWLQDLPDYKTADAYLVAEPTEVFDSEGNVIANYYLQNRRSVTIDQISPYVLKGTVDTEDVRFYQHNGVDPQGIVRAVLVTLKGGHEGASTITQQLVRNTVLSKEQFDKTIKRKVREAYISTQMEKVYTKEQILNMYLNTIYYGHGAYGIEAASHTYFNKSAKDLTLAEAATLSGLPQSPSRYDPTVNPQAAIKRRDTVLARMLSAGDITQEQYDQTIQEPLNLNLGPAVIESEGKYPYFTKYVKSVLEKDFDNNTIMKGGLKVYTTLDQKAQQAAQDGVQKTLKGLGDSKLEQAVVVMDPNTGYVKALVGGRSFDEQHQYNLATQAKRQPGSTFKTFTLAAAINDGMNPNILINCNSPLQVNPRFKVQNYGGTSYGTISLIKATAVSSNTGYVQVAEAIGKDKVAAMANAMGVKQKLPTYDSLTLGSVEVTPLEMCEAYSTLASEGLHRDAIVITKIEDRNGNVVYEHKDNPQKVMEPSVAYACTKVLESVVGPGGTGYNVRSGANINQPISGKTGTTTDTRDLWFCGYTPQLSITVWTGYRDNKSIYIRGRQGFGTETSIPTFNYIAHALLADTPRQDWTQQPDPEYKPNSSWTFIRPVTQYTAQSQSQSVVTEEEVEEPEKPESKQNTQEKPKDTSNKQNDSTTEKKPGESNGEGNANKPAEKPKDKPKANGNH